MKTAIRYRRATAVLLCSILSALYASTPRYSAAVSPNLVWSPYLQQVTDTHATILWTTRGGASPAVRYSTDGSYGAEAAGSSRPLAALGTQLHRVDLADLQPGTLYSYKVYVDGEELLPDQTLAFRTAPRTGSPDKFTFLAFGDEGITTGSQRRLRDQMARDAFDFILTTGDNAYPEASYGDFDTTIFQVYRDVLVRAPIFPTMGNREYRTSGGAPYLDLFELPAVAWRPADQERYYSFDYGSAHIVALDSNAPLDVDDAAAPDDMLDWLRADLAQTKQPWKIVALHHPAYSTGGHGSDSRVRSKLVPIFEAYGVSLVLSGHDHTYQRSLPLRGGQITTTEQGGVVYIVSGAGESASMACGGAEWLAFARCSQPYGLYSRIAVDGGGMTVEAVNETGAVEDQYTFTRQAPAPTYAADSFGRAVTDGWGSAEAGGAYTLGGAPADFDVSGAAGTIALSAANRTRSVYLLGVSQRDVDMRVRVQTDKPAAGGGQMVYWIARRGADGSAYLGRLRLAPDGSVRLQAAQELAGAATLLGREVVVPGLSSAAPGPIWLRAQVVGAEPTSIRLKAWAGDQPEPDGWQYGIADATPGLQAAGAVGLRAYLAPAVSNAPVLFTFDDLRVSGVVAP
ncbi:MAG: metallophosphoesterase family protein [Kouleothrix sp.]|nr:metallophosphoesterase family protein [Kouleothrix sp.]